MGLPKQRNSYQSSLTFLCFESPTVSFASQCNLFHTMWPYLAKGLFGSRVLPSFVYIRVCRDLLLIMHYFLTYASTGYLFWYSRCFFLFSDYLLSNNSVNSIIIHKFDFSDEEVRCLFINFIELILSQICKTFVRVLVTKIVCFCCAQVLAYYISFLKTLSLKLNRHTVHFFFNEVSYPCHFQVFYRFTKLIFLRWLEG